MDNKVVTFGEVLMRLTPPGFLKISQTSSLGFSFGGSETNVAVSLAHLGMKSEFVTRLPKNDVANACVMNLRSHGVETDNIVYGGDRIGLYFSENTSSVRVSKITYDRANSAFVSITPDMIDWNMVLKDASWFHWSGIGPGLSQDAADTCFEALDVAKKLGITVSCDLNYRKNLWKYGKSAQEVMAKLADKCDILFGTEEEYQVAFGVTPVSYKVTTDTEPIDLAAHEKFFQEVMCKAPNCKKAFVALRNTLDAKRHLLTGLLYADGKIMQSRTYYIEYVVDCVGVGDAFAAGMIYGLSNYPDDDRKALEFSIAASTLKNTISGDFNLVTADEVKALMGGNGSGSISR